MTGLNHDFLLLSAREHAYADYANWINNPDAISLHDDLMRYLRDTLNWVACYNPARNMTQQKGLSFYGPTIIKKDGAVIAERLFSTWATLFAIGPKRIELTGPYCWIEGKPKDTGSYRAFKVDRDDVVQRLRTVAEHSRSVANSNDELFLLHLGI